MLAPHPQESELIQDKEVGENWRTWFRETRDHVNRGQLPSEVQNITASGGIPITSDATKILIRVQSATTGNVDITANPQIAKGFDGQIITIEGQDDTKTVQLDDGNGLKLAGGTSFTLGEYDIISFHYNGIKKVWIENNRSNN